MTKHGEALNGRAAALFYAAIDLTAKAGIYPADMLEAVADALDKEARTNNDRLDYEALHGIAAMLRTYAKQTP